MNGMPAPQEPHEGPDQKLRVVPTRPSAGGMDPRLERFRRGLGRLRSGETPDDEANLELAVLLLREENARLKADLHRPTDVGTMTAMMRRTAAEQGEDELSDEVWSLLSDCLVIQEELTQACEEIKTAMTAVQQRLRSLTIAIERSGSKPSNGAIHSAGHGLPHGVIDKLDSAP